MRPTTLPAVTADKAPWALRTASSALLPARRMPAASGNCPLSLPNTGDSFSSGPPTCFSAPCKPGTWPSAASGLSRSFCATRVVSTAARIADWAWFA